ncbi:MAG TPA: hypothetical protein VF458_18360 [Ktedonobacteraceae bacterium]
MNMQEFEQEGQEQQEQGSYGTGYVGRYEMEQQKIQPYGGPRQGYAFQIVAIILSSLGFGFTLTALLASAIVLNSADGIQPLVVGGVLGLVGSILGMLVNIAIFVLTVVFLARSIAQRRGLPRVSVRRKSLGNPGW